MRKPTVALSDLPPEAQKRVKEHMAGNGAAAPRKQRERRAMSMDQVRSHALDVLAVVSELPQSERTRVLRHALKVNDV